MAAGVPAAEDCAFAAAVATWVTALSPRPPMSLRAVSAQVSPIFRQGAKKASHRLMVLASRWQTVASQSFPFKSTKRPRLPTASEPIAPAVKTARMVRGGIPSHSSAQ